MTTHPRPGPAPIPPACGRGTFQGDAERLHLHESARLRAAALHARRVIPGPLGELAHRELCAYAEFGYRFAADSLIPRLATEILAIGGPAHADAA